MFGALLTLTYTVLLTYILWRATSVPWLARRISRRGLLGVGAVLWLAFALGQSFGHDGTGAVAATLELVGMTLLGTTFLVSTALFAVDLATGFGRLLPRRAPAARGWALLAGVGLAVLAVVQGVRAPAVISYEVQLPALPAALDGRVLVALSDTHLGSQLGASWFAERLAQVRSLRPDLVVFLGDIFEGHGAMPRELPALRRLRAPLGKWFVSGNHEAHRRGGAAGDLTAALERAGVRRLRDRWAEPAAGLVLAGVDDLTSHERRGLAGDPLADALARRPPGATVLLSHTPWQAARAARAGVDLMLSGHTHGGQLWPFSLIVTLRYPLLAGRYEIDGMPLIVSRGTGTWGPRMRLWQRGEMLKVILRSGSSRGVRARTPQVPATRRTRR